MTSVENTIYKKKMDTTKTMVKGFREVNTPYNAFITIHQYQDALDQVNNELKRSFSQFYLNRKEYEIE